MVVCIVKIIDRPEYLDFLVSSKDRPIIKVVSGLRRSGKSTLFDVYRNWLLKYGATSQQIISVNFEEPDHEHLTDHRLLCDYIKPLLILRWR